MSNSSGFDLKRITLFLVCPSLNKECGIGRYTLQVASAIRPLISNVRTFTNTNDAVAACYHSAGDVVVIFQHEYSLADFNSYLAEYETTSDIISNLNKIMALGDRFRVCVVMHTLVPSNIHTEAVNKQFLSARMPLFSTSREGAQHFEVNFLELGCPHEHVKSINQDKKALNNDVKFERIAPVQGRSRKGYMRVASFGFLSPNKDVNSVLELCAETGAQIRANFASDDDALVQGVLDKALALNVKGKITFDFLSESALVEMLQRCDVVYLPQNDNKHFSTSATARLGLALGKVVIVPPVRPFHDLASAVVFADLDRAIECVNTLSIDTTSLIRLATSSEDFAFQNRMSEIYSQLCEKLFDYKVWCGGKNHSSVLKNMHREISIVEVEDESASVTFQNVNGFRTTGRAIHQGLVVFSDLKAEPAAVQLPNIAPYGLGTSWQEIEQTEHSFLQAQSDHSEEAWVESYTRTGAMSYRQITALMGTNAEYLSVLDFLDAPSFCQLCYLHNELNLPVNLICNDFLRMENYRINPHSIDDDISYFSDRLKALKQLLSIVPFSKSRLIWHTPLSSWVSGRKRVVLPSGLLSYPVNRFVQSAYVYLLGRHADKEGLLYFRESMQRGATKTDIAWALGTSPEIQNNYITLAYTPELWRIREKQVERRATMCNLFASSDEINRSQNLIELDKSYVLGISMNRANSK